MARILNTGIVTLDIVNHVPHYPAEDEELRASTQQISSGGNAANTSQVLAQFKHGACFCGVIADDNSGEWLNNSLRNNNVETKFASIQTGDTPTSYITVNERTGSRTIVHHRKLSELTCAHFKTLPLEEFDWFHFEGRNTDETLKMLKNLQTRRVDQPISLELEKHRDGLESLIPFADILLFSKPYVIQAGHPYASSFIESLRAKYPDKLISVTWGKQGAWGYFPADSSFHIPATLVSTPIDTLGAGDTYNAGLIHGLCSGMTFKEAMNCGSELAARKIQQLGFSNLV